MAFEWDERKRLRNIAKLDPEVVDFFKAGGRGHLTRMQAVLRAYVDAQRRRREASRD